MAPAAAQPSSEAVLATQQLQAPSAVMPAPNGYPAAADAQSGPAPAASATDYACARMPAPCILVDLDFNTTSLTVIPMWLSGAVSVATGNGETAAASVAPGPQQPGLDPQVEALESQLAGVRAEPRDFSKWVTLLSTADKLVSCVRCVSVTPSAGFLATCPRLSGAWDAGCVQH